MITLYLYLSLHTKSINLGRLCKVCAIGLYTKNELFSLKIKVNGKPVTIFMANKGEVLFYWESRSTMLMTKKDSFLSSCGFTWYRRNQTSQSPRLSTLYLWRRLERGTPLRKKLWGLSTPGRRRTIFEEPLVIERL